MGSRELNGPIERRRMCDRCAMVLKRFRPRPSTSAYDHAVSIAYPSLGVLSSERSAALLGRAGRSRIAGAQDEMSGIL